MYMQVFSLLLVVIFVQGFSVNAPIEKETNKWGTEISFCTYKGVRFLPGSWWRTMDCETCLCFDHRLFCDGLGYDAGVVDVPEGCKVVHDGCQARMVKVEDELKHCPLPE